MDFTTNAKDFIARAEASFNQHDVERVIAGYAPSALLEFYNEGIHDTFRGIDAIRRAWTFVFVNFPRFQLTKQLVSADPSGAIVNEWNGSFDGERASYGLDLWWLDESGAVTHHKVLGFGHVVAYSSWHAKVRWMAIHPRLSLRTAQNRRRLLS